MFGSQPGRCYRGTTRGATTAEEGCFIRDVIITICWCRENTECPTEFVWADKLFCDYFKFFVSMLVTVFELDRIVLLMYV